MCPDPMTPGGGAVTLPNELRQLDEDFAAGRLSPEDYRRRRDELQQAGTRQDGDAPAGSAPQAVSPFPPAFRWETSPPEQTTQVMQAVPRNTGGGDPAEAIQVVRTGDVQDSERTQMVAPTPVYQAPVYQASPSYQQQPAEVQDLFRPVGNPPVGNSYVNNPHVDNSAPPWAGSDLPPIAEAPLAEQQSAWMRQGPEVFETPAMQSRPKQIIGIALLAVLVVGLVGAGVAYFLSSGSPNQAAITQPAPPHPNQPQPPPPAVAPRELPAPPAPSPAPADTQQALIDPPGQSRGGGGLLDLPRLASSNLLPRPILNALRTGAMTDGVLKTTTVGGNTIGMFAFALRDEQAATDVVNTITTAQRDGGLTVDDTRAKQGLAVLGTGEGVTFTVYRAVYVLYDRAIFIEVFGSDRDSVLSAFDFVVNQQVNHAPPTVRGR